MKILIVETEDTCGLDFAMKCMEQGHEVKLFAANHKDGSRTKDGDGIVQKVKSWEPYAGWADLIFPTSNDKYIKGLGALAEQGYPVFASPPEGVKLEIERGYGMKFLEKAGIDVPPFKTFSSLKEAENFVWKSDKRYVFKTLGDNDDKSLSYCSKSPADMIQRLKTWQKEGKNIKGAVMLQEFVNGVEFSSTAFFGPGGFNDEICESFEHKKHYAGNSGVNTGEMGTVCKFVDKSKIFNEVLKPLRNSLHKIGFVGYIDVNCIVDEKGTPYPLEFTCRPGWPHWSQVTYLTKGDKAKWMLDLVNGKDSHKVSHNVGVCAIIVQPCFPYGRDFDEGNPLYGYSDKNKEKIALVGMMKGKAVDMVNGEPKEIPMYVSSGSYVAVINGDGETVKDAMKSCYSTIDELYMSNMGYRNDIGKKMEEEIPKLQKHGFAEEWKFK